MKFNIQSVKAKLRQPKYAAPLVALLPILYLEYTLADAFGPKDTSGYKTATEQVNDQLPETAKMRARSRYEEMNDAEFEEGITALHVDDDTAAVVSEEERRLQQEREATRAAQQAQLKEIQEQINANRSGASSSASHGSSSNYSSEMEAYQKEIERIRKMYDDEEEDGASTGSSDKMTKRERIELEQLRKEKEEKEKIETVTKAPEPGAGHFTTVSSPKEGASQLIQAMIDQTIKAKDGSRLRLKLLSDVYVKGLLLKKGTYLYATVKGFGDQRVKAQVRSILVGDTFIPVQLSIYDIDGMEGFYVPASEFRDLVKDVGSSTLSGNNINISTGTEDAESMALQAIQNAYQGITRGLSSNIRRNRATIKYNTVVYLINTKDMSNND